MSKTIDQIEKLIKEIDDISTHYMTDENKKFKTSLEKLKKTAEQELKESRVYESVEYYDGSLAQEFDRFKAVVEGLRGEGWDVITDGNEDSAYDDALNDLSQTFEDFLDFWWHVAYKPNSKTYETAKQYAFSSQKDWKAFDELIDMAHSLNLGGENFNNRFNKMGKQDALWAAIELDDYAKVTGILSKILKK